MEFEARTQHDLPQFAVILDGRAFRHLRRGAVAVVLAVERVEDQEGVVARHRRRRPDRVEHGKIRLGREFHHPLFGAERQRRRGERRREKRCRGGSFQEISSAQFPPFSPLRSIACAREMAPVEGEPDDLISRKVRRKPKARHGHRTKSGDDAWGHRKVRHGRPPACPEEIGPAIHAVARRTLISAASTRAVPSS